MRESRTSRTKPGADGQLPVAGPAAAAGSEPGLLDDASRLREALSELVRVIQFRDRDRVCCYDISVSQCYALEAIVDHGGSTVNDLAAHLYLDKSTASRLANGLVQKGYVRRVPNSEDGRSVTLEPSTRARKLVERVKWDLAGEYVSLLADFDARTRASIVKVVGRLGTEFASRVEVTGGSCCVIR